MKPQSTPIHMNAKKEDIAEIVLFPGDPLRAKYIAQNFLKDAKEVTNVRNMLGYTGYYGEKRVTVMGCHHVAYTHLNCFIFTTYKKSFV